MYKHNILLITIVVKHLFVKRFTKVIDLIYFNKSFQLSKDKCSCRIFETYDLIFTIQSINLRQDCKLRESYKLRLNLTVNQNIRKKSSNFVGESEPNSTYPSTDLYPTHNLTYKSIKLKMKMRNLSETTSQP